MKDHYEGLDPIDVAKTWLSDKNIVPYFATALHTLVPIKKKGIQALATDMYWRLYYDEEWCRTQPVHVLATVLVHELWHNLNMHGIRGKDMPTAIMHVPETGQSWSVWNVAGDLAINSMMEEEAQGGFDPYSGKYGKTASWEFPEGVVFPHKFNYPNGLLEEDYFNRLMADVPQSPMMMPSPSGKGTKVRVPSGGQSSNSGSDGDESDEEDSGGGGEEEEDADQGHAGGQREDEGAGGNAKEDESDEEDSEGAGGEIPAPMRRGCGSSATGHQAPWEEDPPDPSDDETPPGLSEHEAESVVRKTAQAVEEASLSRGDVPGNVLRWAEKKLHSKIPWEQQLRSEARRAFDAAGGMVDYTFARRNRRQGMLDRRLVLPGMYAPEVNAAMVVDTSGSMSDEYLERGMAEVERVARACGARGVTVLAVDAAVHTVKRIRQSQGHKVELVGRGGTDMRVGIRHASEELHPKPDVIIVFTDGETRWPKEPVKGSRLIVVLIGHSSNIGESGRSRQAVPAWVKRVIAVEVDKV